MKTSQLIEKNLHRVLEKYEVSKKLTPATVKAWILHDEGKSAMDASNRYQKKWFPYFAALFDRDEFNELLQVFVDAWNYFPHESLRGRSPHQIMQRELKKHPRSRNMNEQRMPDVMVGGRKMSWDAYEKMIAEMERLQVPFKNWVEKDVLPKYEQFLRASRGAETVKKHLEVADIFFERAMHTGFLQLSEIRKEFIQQEFPHWWPTHILMSNLREQEVLSSLRRLFKFITATFGLDIEQFGF